MLQASEQEILSALDEANPWWQSGDAVPFGELPPRAYLPGFMELIQQHDARRAVLLLGQRRIGKTVMAHHAIRALLKARVSAKNIMFCSTDAPVFGAVPLPQLVRLFERRFERRGSKPLYVFLDEIQYLREWERHLKVLVDSKPGIRFIATGSAAAALRHKSIESGVGRITEFYLPPLTFAEYLIFTNQQDRHFDTKSNHVDMAGLNRVFVDWLNYGGFPETIFSRSVRQQPVRFIKQDILDKVLLRDLPSLYGVANVQELYRFFTLLAYNTGQEVSLGELAQRTNINKATLNKYLEYLEAAFLIRRSYRVDQDARHFKRVTKFKVYLTNPSLRAALYSDMREDDRSFGALVETGVAIHLQPRLQAANFHYARWPSGEVDFVSLTPDQSQVALAIEVKWSDSAIASLNKLKPLAGFVRNKSVLTDPVMTTRSKFDLKEALGQRIHCIPVALFCLWLGVLELTSALPASLREQVLAQARNLGGKGRDDAPLTTPATRPSSRAAR